MSANLNASGANWWTGGIDFSLGSILQNYISAENFSDKLSPSIFGQISTQKQHMYH
jgi:hypothetical protein